MHNSSCLAVTGWTPAAEGAYTEGYNVVIPKAPRLPHDLVELMAFVPCRTTLRDHVVAHARKERSAYIAGLIAETLGDL